LRLTSPFFCVCSIESMIYNNSFCFHLEHLECFLFLQVTCLDIIDSPVDGTTRYIRHGSKSRYAQLKAFKQFLATNYPQKLALTSPTSGGPSVGIVRSRTKATELVS
jgi:hypothetical protein